MKRVRGIFKAILVFLISLIGLLILIFVLINLPFSHRFLTRKINQMLSSASIPLKISSVTTVLPRSVYAEGVIITGPAGDTIIYAGKIKASIRTLGLFNQKLILPSVNLENSVVNISTNSRNGQMNIAEAFSHGKTDSVVVQTEEKKQWDVSVGKAEISRLSLIMTDSAGGIYIHQNVNSVRVETDKMSLIDRTVLLRSLEIDGATGTIILDSPPGEKTAGDNSPWNIGLAELSLSNINLIFDDPGEKLKLDLVTGDMKIKTNKIDIKNRVIDFEKISVSRTNAVLHMDTQDQKPVKQKGEKPVDFSWEISGEKIRLQDVSCSMLKYSESGSNSLLPGFSIAGLELELSDLQLSNSDINADIEKLNFKLGNGFSLNKMRANIYSHSGRMGIDIVTETANSLLNLKGNAEGNFFDILAHPSDIRKAEISVSNSLFSLSDFLCFKADFQKDPLFNTIAAEPIALEAKILLDDSVITMQSLSISQASNIRIALKGEIKNIFLPEKATSDLKFLVKEVDNKWLKKLLKGLHTGVVVPDFKNLSIAGSISDTLRSPHFSLNLMSDLGSVNTLGSFDFRRDAFSAKTIFDKMLLDRISGNPLLGSFSGTVEINGKGIKSKPLIAEIRFQIDTLQFKGYNYTKASADCSISQNKYDLKLLIDDPSIKLSMTAYLNAADSALNIESSSKFLANLRELHLYKDTLTVEGSLTGEFKKHYSDVNGKLEFSGIKLSTPHDVTNINQIHFSLIGDSGKTSLTGKADFFNAEVTVEKPFEKLNTVLSDFRKYMRSFPDQHPQDSTGRISLLPEMNASLDFRGNKLIGILTGDTTLHFTDLKLTLINRRADNRISCNIMGKALEYKMTVIGNLNVNVTDSSGILNLKAKAEDCMVYSYPLNKIEFNSSFSELRGNTRASILGPDNEMVYDIEMSESVDTGKIVIEIPSKQFIMNRVKWLIDSPHVLTYNRIDKKISPALRMHTNGSFINISTTDSAGVRNYKFELADVTLKSLLKDDLIQGKPEGSISGNAEYLLKGDKGKKITADLHFGDIGWSDLKFNKIDLKGYFFSEGPGDYDIDMLARLDSAEIILKGRKPANGPRLINAGFKSIPVRTVQPFVKKYLSDLKGNISGEFNLSTKDAIESFAGELNINNGNMRINTLNSVYRFPVDRITFTGKKMVFKDFKVLDSLSNELSVDGNVDFSNKNLILTDLEISSSNLQIMNRKEDKNSSFYGDIFIDSKLSIKGSVTSPVLKGKIVLMRGTDIYLRQKENLTMSESEKVLTFVSKNPFKEQYNQESDYGNGIYNKTSVESVVEIDPATRINVTLSQKMFNIELMIKGGGELFYNMLVNNRVNLSGKYEVSEGSADLKMIGWPNKKFVITKGGLIRWDGKLDDPELQFEAVNKVHSSYTNPVDNKQREVDFNVLLKLSNRLSSLDVLFTINTADQYLMSIINTLSPEEQMRQAITILLFEKIDLPGISTSSSYVSEQVNQLVASQLNQLTKTTIKGIDISFGLDTYVESPQTGSQQTKTSLSYDVRKSLLNNRARIEISGRLNDYSNQQSSSNLSLNNFSFEYQIDSLGTKFVKVYNERSYEDVFEGEVIKTGVGFTYRRSYRILSDIWKKQKKNPKPNSQDK